MSLNIEEGVQLIGSDLFGGGSAENTETDQGGQNVDTNADNAGDNFDDAGSDASVGGDGTDNLGDQAGAAADPAQAAADAAAKAAQEASGAQPLVAPRTWRPEAAALWAQVPPAVQAEIAKREEEIFRGLEGYKQDAEYGKGFKAVVDPYAPILQQYGLDPRALMGNFLSAHHTLSFGRPEQKLGLLMDLAKSYGINLQQAVGEEPPYVDPAVKALQDQLQGVQSKLNQTEQRERQAAMEAAERQRNEIKAEIEAFAKDPAHPYFDELQDDIAILLRGGVKSLKDAYDRAVYANPVTRAKEQARAAAEAESKAQAEAKARAAAAARATAANIKTSQRRGSGTAQTRGLEKMGDTMAATLREINNRGQ